MDRVSENSLTKEKDNSKTAFLIQAICIVAAVILAVAIFIKNWNFFHDDSYITLRYANNWISGYGIVWNEGEFVQGYTNFLYLLLVSTLGYFGLDLLFAARLVSFTSYIATAILLWYFASVFQSQCCRDFRHLSITIFITSAPVIIWTLGGLETVLFGFLNLAGSYIFLLSFEKSNSNIGFACSGVLFGLAFLTRPDGIVFIAVTSAFLSWSYLKCLYQERDFLADRSRDIRVRDSRQLAINLIVFLAGCLFIMFPYVFWQISYYGDFVPNTFYAKSGVPFELKFNNGIRYLGRYLFNFPFFLVLTFILLIYRYFQSVFDKRLNYLIILILAYLGFIVFVAGGDHMQSFRMLAPIVPLMSVCLTYLLSSLAENTIRRNVIISAIVIILSFVQILSPMLNPQEEDSASFYGTIVGKYISSEWNRNALIALNTAGSTPYHAPAHRFIDMLGLNDPVIARKNITDIILPWQFIPGHFKGDGDYVLSRKPDFIILGPADGTNSSRVWFLSDYEIVQDQRFHLNYKLMKIFLDKDGKSHEKPDPPYKWLSGNNHEQKDDEAKFLFRYFQKRDKPINDLDF